MTIEEVAAYISDSEFKFGKHKGKSTNQVWNEDPGYIKYLAGEAGMDDYTGICLNIFLELVGEDISG